MNDTYILVVDDETQIQKLLQITLESNGYKVQVAATSKEAQILSVNHPPDIILLDLGLPDEDGHAVLKNLRQWFTKPIIIVSVQSNEDDIVKALDNGANDYIIKPFRTGELLARIRTALRLHSSNDDSPVLQFGDLVIDLSSKTVKKNGLHIKLTATEYALLALFAHNEGKVLTHHYLLKQIWGPVFVEQSQYLRVYIAQLRKKIEDDSNHPVYLITEPGMGYRFLSGEKVES